MNADLLILAQHHFADDEHRLAVLSATGRVVYAEVYVAKMHLADAHSQCQHCEKVLVPKEKPEPGSFFGEDHYAGISM